MAFSTQTDERQYKASPPSPSALHLPTHTWSYRVPSPPRVVVPPPIFGSNGSLDYNIGKKVLLDFEANGFAHSEFLKTVTYGDSISVDNMMAWKYEQRRMAQRILPFLFLGPISAARDLSFLRREGITMIMAVRDTMSADAKLLGSKAAVSAGIESRTIDVAGNQELIAAFPRAIEAVNAHLSARYEQQQQRTAELRSQGQQSESPVPGQVLIFCESGNDRSAGVVAAYIMAMFSLDLISTIQIIQSQRFCVAFDDSMRFMLQSYEAILLAKRDVAKSTPTLHTAQVGQAGIENVGGVRATQNPMGDHQLVRASKRTLDEAYDADMSMDDGDNQWDDERFEKRDGSAPFQDTMKL